MTQTVDFDAILTKLNNLGKEVFAPAAIDVDRDARFPHEAFDALKAEYFLSSYVPEAYGGHGLSVLQISKMCEVIAMYCGSTAMIFAMHQIQVACIVHHTDHHTAPPNQSTNYFQKFMHELVDDQLILASATTEAGPGGDLRSSVCAVEINGEKFTLEKNAPVISYGAAADAILVTCRKNSTAPASDQVQIVARKVTTDLENLCGWDTLGFRGTCSSGYVLKTSGHIDQIIPTPFSEILSQTMHPCAHIWWSSLWLGIATDAVNKARKAVRKELLKNPGTQPLSAVRLAEVDSLLFTLRSIVRCSTADYEELRAKNDPTAFETFGFSIRTNNIKLTTTELMVEIVGLSMKIIGLSAYRNDHELSLCRSMRDAQGAHLMVHNDRILSHNATMQPAYREG